MTIEEQPTPRRRRVAPPVADPMAPTIVDGPVAPAPAPTTTEDRQDSARGSDAGRAPAPTDLPAPRRMARSEPTVPVFVRTGTTTKERFEDLAGAAGLSQREMFEQLVEQAWRREHR